MVLNGLLHDLDLFWREPLLQSGVAFKDSSPTQMVVGTMTRHTQVVIGGNGVGHVDISPCHLDELEGRTNDTCDVLHVVGTIEFGIFGEYLCLDKLH